MKHRKTILLLMALILGSTTVFAQGLINQGGRRTTNSYGPGTCINYMTGLTEKQQLKISELQTKHQESMSDLRIKQRSTIDPIKKNEIRGEMLRSVESHRKEIRNLLTEEQQKQYDLLQSGPYNRNMRYNRSRGKCGYRGQGNFGGRGQSNFRGQGNFGGRGQSNFGRGSRGYCRNW